MQRCKTASINQKKSGVQIYLAQSLEQNVINEFILLAKSIFLGASV